MPRGAVLLAAVAWSLAFGPVSSLGAGSPEGWSLEGWSQRVIASVTQAGSPDVDVAAVRVIHCGLMKPGGEDVRVLDARGNPAPYEIAYLHPTYDALLLVRAQPQDRLTIYFGNADAPPDSDPMRATRGELGSGPPRPGPAANGWIPRAGLVLTTLRRPRETPNPTSVAQMRQLIAASPGVDGADLVPTISHGLNPFGDSDHYISLYRGWLHLPTAGTWGFCTASNEASFSFLDGRDLVHWPGRHTEQRGRHGEKSATYTLDAGLHYVEYAHEEVLLYQTAFLGWKAPGAAHFDAIPAQAWPRPHVATITAYQQKPGQTVSMPWFELLDSLWPRDRPAGQYTRYRFRSVGGPGEHAITWDFGSGGVRQGAEVQHVFLHTGDWTVRMKGVLPNGSAYERAFTLSVFPIEHLEPPFKAGRLDDYVPLVKAQDGLSPRELLEAAHLMGEAGERDLAQRFASRLIDTPWPAASAPSQDTLLQARLLRLGDTGSGAGFWTQDPIPQVQAEAVQSLRQAVTLEAADPAATVECLERLARLIGTQADQLEEALSLLERGRRLAREPRALHVAEGDLHLWHGNLEAAARAYHIAESLNQPVVPPNVRSAKVGAFPHAIEQALADRQWLDAQTVVDEWMQRFPADRMTGAPLFYAGKLAMQRGQPANALRALTAAVRCGRGSEFEAEARYLLAQAYRQTGDEARCLRTLRELVATGLAGPWRDEALKQLGKE